MRTSNKRQKIKIVYIIDELNIGGTEKQLIEIIKRIDKNKFQPILVCLRPSNFIFDIDINCKKIVLNVYSLASLDGLSIMLRFAKYLHRHKVDIVHTFFFDSTVFGVLSSKIARVKKIISSRRDMGFWYTPKNLIVLRIINYFTDRILVNSKAVKNNVVSKECLNPGKIDIIYNGIDLKPFSVGQENNILKKMLGVPIDDKIVGIVANLNRPVKRVDLFIRAAAEILKKYNAVSFLIIGEGHLRDQLEKQVKDLGIEKKIKFTGSQENVIPYLQLFDIAMLTSESEGFSNSVLEYMAAGLPVVCFDAGGNGELIHDGINGYLLNDFSGITKTVIQLLENTDSIKRISKNNLSSVSNFSWESIQRKQFKYYLELL
jgi:glycosyltransferase involved in cell wall biosynthesis